MLLLGRKRPRHPSLPLLPCLLSPPIAPNSSLQRAAPPKQKAKGRHSQLAPPQAIRIALGSSAKPKRASIQIQALAKCPISLIPSTLLFLFPRLPPSLSLSTPSLPLPREGMAVWPHLASPWPSLDSHGESQGCAVGLVPRKEDRRPLDLHNKNHMQWLSKGKYREKKKKKSTGQAQSSSCAVLLLFETSRAQLRRAISWEIQKSLL